MGTLFTGSKGLTILDTLITLCLIGILTGVVIQKYQIVAQEAQESALKAELSNIRTSIRLFQLLNKRNPATLREMIEKKVMLPARTAGNKYTESVFIDRYLMKNAVDAMGNKLDAFGNAFTYEGTTGLVRSSTKGYETW